MSARFEDLGARIVTLRRSRAIATMSLVAWVFIYAVGLAGRHGLIDGFGHLIGGDLLVQRVASQMTRDGNGDRLYDFELQARYEQAQVAPEVLPGLSPVISPPYVALAYWPLIEIRHEVAFAIWTAVGLAALVAALWWLGQDYPWVRQSLPTILLLALSSYIVVEGLLAGSNHLISLLVMTAVFLSFKRGHDGVAGVLLGIQLFKPQVAIATLAVLIFKRRWKALGGVAAVALAWMLASTVFVSTHSLMDYVETLPALSRLAFAEGAPFYLFSSLYALFMIPLGPDLIGISTILGTLASLVVLGILFWTWAGPWQTTGATFDARFAATLIATPLVNQYFMLHDLAILILAAVLLANYWLPQTEGRGWGTMRLAFALLWVVSVVGPIVTQRFRLPLVPLALLVVGWCAWSTAQRSNVKNVSFSGK